VVGNSGDSDSLSNYDPEDLDGFRAAGLDPAKVHDRNVLVKAAADVAKDPNAQAVIGLVATRRWLTPGFAKDEPDAYLGFLTRYQVHLAKTPSGMDPEDYATARLLRGTLMALVLEKALARVEAEEHSDGANS